MKIVVLDDFDRMFATSPRMDALRAIGDVTIHTDPAASVDEVVRRLLDAEAVVANRERTTFTRSLLSQLPNLRLIAQTGHGFGHIDLEAARELGIDVQPTHGGSAQSVVELTLGLMLACTRSIALHDRRIRAGQWQPDPGRELHGRRLGIMGLGTVGSALIPVVQALGMEIRVWGRRSTLERAEALGVTAVEDLDELLRASDVVTIHLRSTPDTRGLLDARRLELLPPGSILVNTSRGAIVDEHALAAALRDGHLTAGLDVYAEEPLPPNHPFRSLDNVVLTPHIGWVTHDTYDRFIAGCVDNILAYVERSRRP